MILAGDIGSTTSSLGLFKKGSNGTPELVTEGKYPSKDYPSMEAMVQEFLQKNLPAETIHAACFGISGPVEGGRGKIVGLSWEVTESSLCELLMKLSWGVMDSSKCEDSQTRIPVEVINSLGAIDFNGLETKEKLVDLNPNASSHPTEGESVPNRAWIAASAGLGEASLYWDKQDREFRVFPSEGGHANFAPRNDLEIELLRYLLANMDPKPPVVTYQRVLSEKGLVYIYQFLKSKQKGGSEVAGLEKLITEKKFGVAATEIIKAAKEKHALCTQTLELFVSIYGAEAGNVAVKYLALGGVYIGGTIAPQIIDKLQSGAFMKAFAEDREDEKIKERIAATPVKVVMNPQIRFFGAAQRALDKEVIGRFVYSNVASAG